MRLALDDEQQARRDATAALLSTVCTTADVRATLQTAAGVSRGRWRRLAELGLTSLTVPEALGGLGATDVDLVVLLEEAGAAGLPEPLGAASTAVSLLVEAAPGAATRWLPALVSGSLLATFAAPGARLVEHAAAADLIVLADASGRVHVVTPDDLELVAQPSLDGPRRWYRATRRVTGADPEQIEGTDGDGDTVATGAGEAIARSVDRATLYAAAELLGVARRSLDLSVAYARDRHQFGRPIGSYQALKHRLADDWIALEFARPLVWRAAWSLAHQLPDASLHVSAAQAAAADAALGAARSAVQVHGAMGYTLECDVQLFLARARSLVAVHGGAREHRRRIAAVLRTRDLVRIP